jgi:P4 family phage/plasmid primase-like protien
VGVRLGTPSLVGGLYLGVIDIDVKSTNPKHRLEAEKAVAELFPTVNGHDPRVLSGRGNGSSHIYIGTLKPALPAKYKVSKDFEKVKMPSAAINARQKELLTENELKEGWRIRPAWEIAVMGEGQQVVLPPSTHPDTGANYAWKHVMVKPILQKLDLGHKDKTIDRSPTNDWLPIECSSLSSEVLDLLKDGRFEDRSAGLFVVAKQMVRENFTDQAIMSVLTNPGFELGKTAYDHASTTSRARAANWIYNYTLKKVREDFDARLQFDEVVETVLLSDEAARIQASELLEPLFVKDRAQGFSSLGKKGGLVYHHQRLLEYFEHLHPYKSLADMKTVYRFNGTHFEECTPIEIKSFAEKHFKPSPVDRIRHEFFTKVVANCVVKRNFFYDTTEGKFNFKNGVVDLRNDDPFSSLLSPHSPEFGFRAVLPYAYDPQAECPLFIKWLRETMSHDFKLIAILQEFMGYIISGGEYKYHKALWLDGAGRNGKSTFITVLKALIGNPNYSTLSIKALVEDRFAGEYLDGKLANFSEETSPKELSDSGPFKNLTGGGDIFAQKKFGDPYVFSNRAKLVMTYNQVPDIKDLSVGMLSRPLIVPFKRELKTEEQDQNMGNKLLTELSGIFNFALEGWQRLESQNGFTVSEKSQLALTSMREESCNVFQWVENYVHFIELQNLKEESVLYTSLSLFQLYLKQEKYAYRQNEFYRRLSKHPKMKDRARRTKHQRGYSCIRVDGVIPEHRQHEWVTVEGPGDGL